MEHYIEDRLEIGQFLIDNDLTINTSSRYDCECDGVVKHYEVKVTTTSYDNITGVESEVVVAVMKLQKIYDTFLPYRMAVDYADTISQQLLDVVGDIYTTDKVKAKAKSRIFYDEEDDTPSILYLEHFEVLPDFRGLGFGAFIVNEVADELFNRWDDVIVLPFAIYDKDNDKAHKRVKSFWDGVGFDRLGKSRYYKYNPFK